MVMMSGMGLLLPLRPRLRRRVRLFGKINDFLIVTSDRPPKVKAVSGVSRRELERAMGGGRRRHAGGRPWGLAGSG